MKLGHRNRGWSFPLSLCLILYTLCQFNSLSVNALSIRREPVTEQVLIITTLPPSDLQQDEAELQTLSDQPATTPGVVLGDEQRDEEAGTTVESIIVADTTGESWEIDPTASSIVSKDVEIEIKDGSSGTSKLSGDNAGAANEKPVDESKPVLPEIYSFRIRSDIQYRYSRTYVTSRVANKDTKRAQEVAFSVVLPETAFISKFIMEIDGKAYEAYVKEKEEAKKDYQQAQSQGQSAGLVEKSTRNSNVFNVNVNVKPMTKVTFNLTYEELLTRRLGRYEQAININPDQVSSIKDYQIEVNIEESRNLTFVRVPSLSNDIEGQDPSGNNPDVVIDRPAANKAKISWSPTTADQKKLVKEGISGKFVVQYDVDREADAGQVLVMQGYFVHFFAPENLPPLRKHVVFILDISGSMWGRKMEQLKESQKKILDDLSSEDYFNIITFSSDVYLWSPNDVLTKKHEFQQPSFPAMTEITPPELLARRQPLPATPENINKAKSFIDSLVASGGTNIHDAIIEALNLTAVIKEAQKNASTPSTEPSIIEETTVVASSGSETSSPEAITAPETTMAVPTYSDASSPPSSSSSTTAKSSSSTEGAPSSTTSGTEEEEESASIVIIDIAKSDLGDIATDKPAEVTSQSTPREQVILPPNVQSLIIFLTDGEPTVGITDPPEIQKLIQAANRNLSIPIFSLGFGEGADFPFLKKLSLQNNGFGRKIYEASDAALQLKGFYNEIASPLLSNVKFNYTSSEYSITDVTVTKFPTVFGGTEVAVAGKLVAQPKPERVDEEGTTISPSNDANPTTDSPSNSETPRMDDVEDDEESPFIPNRLSIACNFQPSSSFFFDVSVEGTGRDGEVDLREVEVYERQKCGFGIDFPFLHPPAGSMFPPRPTPPPTPEDLFLERLWAYLTIQQLIEKDLAQTGDAGPATDADPSENSIDATPSSTAAPDQTSIVTKVLPSLPSTSPRPTNVSNPETPKEKALRLALKYGFVTPLTSLVVVKPNSSDVTNAVSTDARPDALDSLYALVPRSFAMPIVMSLPSPSHSLMMTPMSMSHTPQVVQGRRGGGAARSQISSRRRGGPITSTGSWRHISQSITSGPFTGNYAPQSMSVLSLAVPTAIRNKIASHTGSYPLPLPIHANYAMSSRLPVPLVSASRPIPPNSPFGGGPPSGFGGAGFGGPPGLQLDYDTAQEEADSGILPSPTNLGSSSPTVYLSTPAPPPSTTAHQSRLTLNDITWLKVDQNVLLLNETDYMIARNESISAINGDACEVSGQQGRCSHLRDCVLPEFAKDEQIFRTSYFCPLTSGGSYVGTCCPSSRTARKFTASQEDP